jgi:hypothetical protein
MVYWEWFGIGNVDCGANSFFDQGLKQRIGIDNGAATGIDQEGSGFHLRETTRIDKMPSLGGEGGDEDDDVALRKQVIEPFD